MDEIQIGPMKRRHLMGVLRIERQAFGNGWSMGLFLAELSRPDDRIYLVATSAGSVVGYGGMLLVDNDAHLVNIAVEGGRRRGAIGSRVLLELTRRALAMGAVAVTLEVRASNEAAIALYRRFGLAPVGTRPKYYSDPTEDALIMWATEVDGPEYAARLDAIEASLAPATHESPKA